MSFTQLNLSHTMEFAVESLAPFYEFQMTHCIEALHTWGCQGRNQQHCDYIIIWPPNFFCLAMNGSLPNCILTWSYWFYFHFYNWNQVTVIPVLHMIQDRKAEMGYQVIGFGLIPGSHRDWDFNLALHPGYSESEHKGKRAIWNKNNNNSKRCKNSWPNFHYLN